MAHRRTGAKNAATRPRARPRAEGEGQPFSVLDPRVIPNSGMVSALVLYLAWSLAQMTIILNGITLRQRLIPDSLQGRVNVTARMIAWGGTPFGALVGGALADTLGVRGALAIVAAGVGASALAAWFTPFAIEEPHKRCRRPRRERDRGRAVPDATATEAPCTRRCSRVASDLAATLAGWDVR
jgi:hypothetical protein